MSNLKDKDIRVKVLIALLSVYFIWGSTYLGIRIALEGFPPFLMAGVRFLVTGSGLYLFLRIRGTPNPDRSQWIGATIVGGLLLLGGNGGVVFAEQWVASGLAALGVATVPLWAVLFAGIWKRWPASLEWTGLLLGFTGIILLNFEGDLRASPAGAIALIIAAICWAFGSVWSRHLSLPSGLMASAVEMIAGGALLLAASFLTGEKMNGFPAWRSVGALFYLMIFGSLIGFSAYTYLLRKARPALATSYAYVNPVIAVGLGVVLAGERITMVGITAMLIIIAGVVLVLFGGKRSN
ncbi:MAG: drug/metabolite exporter YedA [Nitrospirae bacterium]|nr:drug/metabolite exporter YedA [Nitrospirota bacterium]MBI3378539.1 drug/metabolite exporter YedA [Nitrospirota bacterium]